MASSSAPVDPVTHDIPALGKSLYDACLPFMQQNSKKVFNQSSLLELGIIPNDNIQVLMQVTQRLINEKLFKYVQAEGLGWKLRTLEEAKKYRSLTPEQELVYGLIDEAGDDGLWTKTIKLRSQLHDAIFRQTIKHLEAKSMISDMKSVEHPTRKMYIKSSIRPSERATGGPWYTDGELDEEFIQIAFQVLHNYIEKKTFYHSSSGAMKKPKKTKGMKAEVKNMTAEEAKAVRDRTLGSRVKEEEVENEKALRKRRFDSYLPMPAGYTAYPTLDELTSYVDSSGYINQILSASEVEHLLEIMCYDNKIEKVTHGPEVTYRALRASLKREDDRPQNVLAGAPCGRCPVFDLCEEGGPVGPSNCEYFNDWLEL